MIPKPFGPEYPRELGATVSKYRAKAKDSIFALSKAERDAWAYAIEKAILAKQRGSLSRETPTHRISCASGTNHSDGRKISAAIREQHRSALLAYPSAERRKRSDCEWQAMYDHAMKQKR